MGIKDFLPSKIRQQIEGNKYISDITRSSIAETSVGEIDSFFYEPQSFPVKSTQQLNVDWSAFENHTFFMSAEVKTNLAFEQIINKFPFDGTKKDVELFLDNLTGFERWVFEQFPKYKGALHFSSSYIKVVDAAGTLYPDLSKKNDGSSILNPADENTPLSLEMQILLPMEPNDGSIVCQKISSSDQGFSLNLLPDTSSLSASLQFVVVSGSNVVSSSATIDKGKYAHLCTIFGRDVLDTSYFYVNEKLISSGSNHKLGKLFIDQSNFFIGSGSTVVTSSTGGLFKPSSTFSGSIDEFRLFHENRSIKMQNLYAQKGVFASDSLKLYYKFNEPALTDDGIKNIVLDSSGNSLHSKIVNFDSSLREENDGSVMLYEKETFNPILFPMHQDVISLNSTLLMSASLFDVENPNIITRLVPKHYLLEGAEAEGFGLNVDGNGNDPYTGDSIPGSGQLGSQQLMLSLLYVWAKFFDEIKLYVDSFKTVEFVDYETNETVPDNFLESLVKKLGFNLPHFFTDSTLEQYLEAENIERDISTSQYALKYIQNQITRRILVSLPHIIASKGTQHSIKAFLRAVGIDPNNSVRIREYGGETIKSLNFAREDRSDVLNNLYFSSNSLLVSPFLSSSRIEPGFPYVSGTPNDGILTSGSWTFESNYKLLNNVESNQHCDSTVKELLNNSGIENLQKQSLVRFLTTGSSYDGLITNLIANPPENYYSTSSITLYARPHSHTSAPVFSLELSLSGTGIFDGKNWLISFGCVRNDEINSNVSSSYFIKAAKQINGEITEYYHTSSFFYEKGVSPSGDNVFRALDSTYNPSGTYISMGENQTIVSAPGNLFLNDSAYYNYQLTSFNGSVSNVRFWSKSMDEKEFLEHARNYGSRGVNLPALNYNYVTKLTGSFEKLRLDCVQKQSQNLASGTNGILHLFDYSENNFHMTGSGFLTGSTNFITDIVNYTHLSPYFDELSTNNKVRVRGLNDQKNILTNSPWATTGPAYKLFENYQPIDDLRFSVDFSLIDSLNRDIINLFSSYDEMNNFIGDTNLFFSQEYVDLEKIRDVYFNRLSGRVNFEKFFEFYRWFDTSISTFIDQLLPKKTRFRGVNFIVEPHMLERSKHTYYFFENYSLRKQQFDAAKASSYSWLIEAPAKKY